MNTETRFRWSVSAVAGLLVAGALMVSAPEARAQAALVNSAGDLAMGINREGHHNISDPVTAVDGTLVSVANSSRLGLAFRTDYGDGAGTVFQDATSPGCFCEGWGVSATSGGSSFQGGANVSVGGVQNLTLDSFTTSVVENSITSSVSLTNLTGLKVTQKYQEAANTDRLFEDKVTITNMTGDTLTDVRYVRVMDWDIPPTEFTETVTIRGTATTTDLEMSHDDGFETPLPLSSADIPIATCASTLSDFTDCNTSDHGAYFRFNFGTLAAGESKEFSIFYGAAATEAAADAAVAAESIELFSYGQHDGDPVTGTPATFIFGFRGVGGTPVIPTPEPGIVLLMGAGLLATAGVRRRRRKA